MYNLDILMKYNSQCLNLNNFLNVGVFQNNCAVEGSMNKCASNGISCNSVLFTFLACKGTICCCCKSRDWGHCYKYNTFLNVLGKKERKEEMNIEHVLVS